MRIANHTGRAILLTDDTHGIDIATASNQQFGPDIQDLYPVWKDFVQWAGGLATNGTAGTKAGTSVPVTVTPEQFGPVTPRPLQAFGIGLNYADHADESGFERPEKLPPVFPQFQSSIGGPFDDVTLVPEGDNDWEVELVIVIGYQAHGITAGTGWNYVAGVTVGQDLSERVTQMAGPAPQFGLGKSFPGYSPQGPWLVTVDELPNRDDLAISCDLDGEVLQEGRTSQMMFDVPTLVEELAAIVTLQPGDCIYSGTPSGVGFSRQPPKLLQPGQTLTSTIEGIGTIRQHLV